MVSALRRALALRKRKGMDAQRCVLLEGLRLHRSALQTATRFIHTFHCPDFHVVGCDEVIHTLQRGGHPAIRLDRRTFSRLSYKAEGIVSVAQLPTPPALRRGLTLILDGLSDPGNIGACLRVANAWGATQVVVVDDGRRLFHPKAIRASTGAILTTPTHQATRDQALAHAMDLAAPTCVLTPEGTTEVSNLRAQHAITVVVGNERRGVHQRWRARADHHVRIPMTGHVDSLNAAVSAAVILWELYRSES